MNRPWTFCGPAALVLFALTSTVALAAGPTLRADQAAGTDEQVAKGKEIFARCAACHGAEGEGKIMLAPRLNSASYLAVVNNDFLKRTVTEGRTGTNMMAWGKMMSEEEIDDVVSYIRHWQTSDGLALDTSPLKGDVEVGAKLWTNICSSCHGRSGAGYSEAGSGTGIGRKGFLSQIDDAQLRSIVAHGKDNTAMRPFKDSPVAVADLTDVQIDSIIKYLRANAW